tara:strand:+ start:973 stop:1500 length:528 start_codon:yes stop_codon:yes gene_type:complete
MKKIIFITFLFFLSLNSNALAFNCDLSKFQLGKSLSNFEKEKELFVFGEVLEGINAISIPIEFPCKENEASGTLISLFFIDDKVVRIIFENTIKKNKPLFKIANTVYKVGFKKNQKIIDKGQPEQYAIEKNGVYYLYADIKGINENKGNFFELFEIVDKKYEDAATKDALKVEEQ